MHPLELMLTVFPFSETDKPSFPKLNEEPSSVSILIPSELISTESPFSETLKPDEPAFMSVAPADRSKLLSPPNDELVAELAADAALFVADAKASLIESQLVASFP